MSTSLDINDDLLAAAKEIAQRQKRTAGEVVSNLLRQALAGRPEELARTMPSGFRPFASCGVFVTDAMIGSFRIIEGV